MQKLELINSLNETSTNFVALVLLNKPDQANALDRDFIKALTHEIESLHSNENCRGLLIAGLGKNFCAGAHLKWMQDSAKLSNSENLNEAKNLTLLYESIVQAPFPTMAFVRGSAYGGGVGLAAACNIVIANDDAKFCLSEVRLGLIPAVILPYVQRRMTYGALNHYALSAKTMSADEALRAGLAEVRTDLATAIETLSSEWQQLLQGGPKAQMKVKALIQTLQNDDLRQSDETAKAIADVRSGPEAQLGLQCFFHKKKPSWVLSLKKPDVLSVIIQ